MKVCDCCKKPGKELKEYVIALFDPVMSGLNSKTIQAGKVDACFDCREKLKQRVYNAIEDWKMNMPDLQEEPEALYYIECTTRHGKRELIAVQSETGKEVFGVIVASDVVPEDVGTRWSNTKEYLTDTEQHATMPKSHYDFTMKPVEFPEPTCLVVFGHPRGTDAYHVDSLEEGYRLGANLVMQRIDKMAEEDAPRILDLIRAWQFEQAISEFCEKTNDSAGMGEQHSIRVFGYDATVTLSKDELAAKALDIRNREYSTAQETT